MTSEGGCVMIGNQRDGSNNGGSSMKRNIVLGVLLGVASLSLVVAAQQQAGRGGQPAPKVVEVEKMEDKLFVLKGGGGDTNVFLTASGGVVGDAEDPRFGQTIPDKIHVPNHQ